MIFLFCFEPSKPVWSRYELYVGHVFVAMMLTKDLDTEIKCPINIVALLGHL